MKVSNRFGIPHLSPFALFALNIEWWYEIQNLQRKPMAPVALLVPSVLLVLLMPSVPMKQLSQLAISTIETIVTIVHFFIGALSMMSTIDLHRIFWQSYCHWMAPLEPSKWYRWLSQLAMDAPLAPLEYWIAITLNASQCWALAPMDHHRRPFLSLLAGIPSRCTPFIINCLQISARSQRDKIISALL